MQIEELAKGILAKFEKSRIVFWYDPDRNFSHEILALGAEGVLEGIEIVNMLEESVLQTKKRIELDQPEQKFLLYFPSEEPEAERDWLLDVRLYNDQFYADHSSMLLTDLGIPKMALRGHIRKRKDFFNNKQRFVGLHKWVTENEDEQSLDRKMAAVLVKADSAGLPDILLSLLKEYALSLGNGDDATPLFAQLQKYGVEETLWALLKEEFAYDAKEPSIADFTLQLFCTELWSQIDGGDRDALLNNVLKTASGRATAQAFMVSWRRNSAFVRHYEEIEAFLSQALDIRSISAGFMPIQVLECETFKEVENNIIRGLVNLLLDTGKVLDRVRIDTIISRRLASHWCHGNSQHGKEYKAIYEAIRAAEELMYLRHQHVDGFHYDSAKAMYTAYVDELYKFDQAYRKFNAHERSVKSKGAGILHALDQEVENLYSNWYCMR